MKKSCRSFLSLIFSFVFILSVIALTPVHLFADPYFPGEGTEAIPFQISTADQLAQMATLVNEGNSQYKSAYYQVTTDIDLSGTENWIPIGQTGSTAFSGFFNGNGHRIIGLMITAEVASGMTGYYGLFGYNQGQIKQIELVGNAFTVIGLNMVYVGGIVGYNDFGMISDCSNAGTISGQFSSGIVGKNYYGTINDCYNMGPVSGYYVGGIAGDNIYGTISGCNNMGTVYGTLFGGGITGCNEKGLISNSYNMSPVSSGYRSGGIAGKNSGLISGCYNMGTVFSKSSGGGISGYDGSGTISDCYNTGTVYGKTNSGGIIGYNSNGTISDCYNTGTVSGETYVGGITGINPNGTINATYFLDNMAEGIGDGAGTAISCTLEQMLIAETYIGFDFINTWIMRIDNNYSLPQLRSVPMMVNQCIVIFDSQGGSPVNPTSTNYITKIAAPTSPTKNGYKFGGWYKDAACTDDWVFATDVVTADITLFAKWNLVAAPTVSYRSHVQDIGWQGWVSNGAMSGTSGMSKRLEGMEIKLENVSGGIEYRTHVQDYGWMAYVADGAMSGTSGQSKRLEAINIRLTGEAATLYDIYYRVHAQEFGWLDWAKNNEPSGTAGFSYRLEAIEIVLVTKGGAAPGPTTRTFVDKFAPVPTVSYRTHVQDVGWQVFVSNGTTSGTSGQSKRLEGIEIKLENVSGGIEYRTHVQDYGWLPYVANGTMSGTSGQSKRLEAINIRLTGEAATLYDVYYRVHAQEFGWLGWAKNDQPSGTAGFSYRLEAIQIVLVNKGGSAPGSTSRAFVQH